RIELLRYSSSRSDQDAIDMRARQISWFVRNDPGKGILGTERPLIFPMPGSTQDTAGYEWVKRLWLEQVAKDRENAFVLGHATWLLQLRDPQLAEELLSPAV